MNAARVIAFVFLIVLAVAGCQQTVPTSGVPASGGARGGTLRVGLENDAAGLDPHVGTTINTDRHLQAAIYDGLTDLDKDLKVVPSLAVSWETPNNVTYVFKLRQGVKFHDGTDFNAQAVKFNIDRILDPANNSHQLSNLRDVKSVEVVDDHTVKFNLKQPSASLLSVLTDRAGRMVSPAALQKLGKDYARNPVGTGPFQFVEWLKDDHITVKKFPNYWDKGKPYLDGITYRFIPDGAVKLTELKTGNLDIVDSVPPKDVAGLRGISDLKVSELPGLGYRVIYLNTSKPPFDRKALRQAVAWAIDREAIQKTVFYGLVAPSVGPISRSSWAFDRDLKGYSRDVAKARAQLAEGGQPNGFKFALQVYNDPLYIQLAQVIKEQLAGVGIEADLRVGERVRILADMRAKNHVAALSAWSGYPDPDTDISLQYYSKGGNNAYVGGYKNPQVDELFEKASASLKVEERREIYHQVQRLIVDDAPAVFLVSPWDPEVKVTGRKVKEFTHIPDGVIRPSTIALKE